MGTQCFKGMCALIAVPKRFILRGGSGNKMSEKVKRGIAQTCNSFLLNREISFVPLDVLNK